MCGPPVPSTGGIDWPRSEQVAQEVYRSIGPRVASQLLDHEYLAEVAADHAVATHLFNGQKRHVRDVEQSVSGSLVEPRVISHGKRERLSSCPFLRPLQQRGTNSSPPCGGSNAKIDDPENGHGGLANAHHPVVHSRMAHEIVAAPGEKAFLRDLLEPGPSPMRTVEACIKQVGDGGITDWVREIRGGVFNAIHAAGQAPS